MQIVIDISEKIYDTIMSDEMPTIEQMSAIVVRIYQGIPLPKGHGRLIDADELYLDIQTDEEMRLGEHLKWVKERFDNAPTIIEADTESEEKK